MCHPVVTATLGVLSAAGGYLQDNQAVQAQKRANDRQRALVRQQTINKYDEIALKRQADRAAASREIDKNKRQALRRRESARTSAGERGSAGLSLNALIRDLGAQEGRANEGVRDQVRFSNAQLDTAARGGELQTGLKLNAIQDPATPSPFGAARSIAGHATTIRNELIS
ncbi:MAG: hypothetical protein AAF909_09350 [Pseudomonadota bacterium]